MTTYIQNYDYTNRLIKNNDNIDTESIELFSNYDGNVANINMLIEHNGNQKSLNFNLDNKDILNLFNVPSNNSSLDQRLIRDFLSPSTNTTTSSIIEFPNVLALGHKKHKRKTKKHKSRKTKSKKNILRLFQ